MLKDKEKEAIRKAQGTRIGEGIFRIPGEDSPLSSDIFIVEGKDTNYIFDAGASERILELLETLGEKTFVISHFHQDHTGNLKRLKDQRTIQNKLQEPVYLEDGRIEVKNLSSSHAKGSLMMEVDGFYLLLGDGLGPMMKGERLLYNAQFLKEEIKELEETKAEVLLLGHGGKTIAKTEALAKLKAIYQTRTKNDPYIEVKSFW